jgi:hypothetical protein
VGPIIPVVVSGSALPAGNQGFQIVSQLPGGELIIDERVVFALSDRGRSETHMPHHLFKGRGPVGNIT